MPDVSNVHESKIRGLADICASLVPHLLRADSDECIRKAQGAYAHKASVNSQLLEDEIDGFTSNQPEIQKHPFKLAKTQTDCKCIDASSGDDLKTNAKTNAKMNAQTDISTRQVHGCFARYCCYMIRQTQAQTLLVLAALVYIHRLGIRNSSIRSASSNGIQFRVFACALMLSCKMFDDKWTCQDAGWQHIACIKNPHELARLEREFLDGIDYDLCVAMHELQWVAGLVVCHDQRRVLDTCKSLRLVQ